jgi:hypothetical protein
VKQALRELKNAILIILLQPDPPTNNEKVASAAEFFRPLARELERLVALYRRLREPYVAKISGLKTPMPASRKRKDRQSAVP